MFISVEDGGLRMKNDLIALDRPYATTRDGYDACAGAYDA
jgi:hypothetical protein